jgi:hypothetical protein
VRGASSFDGVLRPRALIHTCGIGGGRVGFVTCGTMQFASGTYSSSSMTPAFVSHLMRSGAGYGNQATELATA